MDNYGYVDIDNKLCYLFSYRAGCSITFKCYLDQIGLLEDAIKYSPEWIHNYRVYLLNTYARKIDLKYIIENNYKIVKPILNPYRRIVSCWRFPNLHLMSFRNYINELLYNDRKNLHDMDKLHSYEQYIEDEDLIITDYIKLDLNDKIIRYWTLMIILLIIILKKNVLKMYF